MRVEPRAMCEQKLERNRRRRRGAELRKKSGERRIETEHAGAGQTRHAKRNDGLGQRRQIEPCRLGDRGVGGDLGQAAGGSDFGEPLVGAPHRPPYDDGAGGLLLRYELPGQPVQSMKHYHSCDARPKT